MLYDLEKCNNLDWKSERAKGFLKVFGDNKIAAIVYNDKEKYVTDIEGNVTIGEPNIFYFDNADEFSDAIENMSTFRNFQIVPRNPEKYSLFKAGDELAKETEDGYSSHISILYRVSNFTVYVTGSLRAYNSGVGELMFSTNVELFQRGYRLELTDYEKYLKNAAETVDYRKSSSETKPHVSKISLDKEDFPIKIGEKMLCKGRLSKWGIGKFAGFNNNSFYPFIVKDVDGGDVPEELACRASGWDVTYALPYDKTTESLKDTYVSPEIVGAYSCEKGGGVNKLFRFSSEYYIAPCDSN